MRNANAEILSKIQDIVNSDDQAMWTKIFDIHKLIEYECGKTIALAERFGINLPFWKAPSAIPSVPKHDAARSNLATDTMRHVPPHTEP